MEYRVILHWSMNREVTITMLLTKVGGRGSRRALAGESKVLRDAGSSGDSPSRFDLPIHVNHLVSRFTLTIWSPDSISQMDFIGCYHLFGLDRGRRRKW